MTVKELIKKLKSFNDPDIEVKIHSGGFGPKEISSVHTEYVRYIDGVEYLDVVIHGNA